MDEDLGRAEAVLPVFGVRPAGLPAFLAALPAEQAEFVRAQDFAAVAQSLVLLPARTGLAGALLGIGEDRSAWAFGGLAAALPGGPVWRITPGDFDPQDAVLGFLLGAYRYDRLKMARRAPARLDPAQLTPRVRAMATAIAQARDLINTPPNLLGPSELAAEAAAMGAAHGATVQTLTGAALGARFPALHAVGVGSDRAPAVVVLEWTGSKAGADAKFVSLCGKGVCFDTGGYDLKPSAAMLRMKKDMGGAAVLIGLARLIMTLDLPIRLSLRVGCVENSISGHAMRPSDVLTTTAGKTVEIGNTDAEGRLVLCDLLAEAAAEAPDWLIDAATLTGAARVALGPDLPALFCNDEDMATRILAGGEHMCDPLWRLPLFDGYDGWLDSTVADLNNVSSKPFGGAIVAALFLRRFIAGAKAWAHIDLYAWNDQARPGRPEGGEAQTLRAMFGAIESLG